jgi:putative tricarboxylic transport membrane protein
MTKAALVRASRNIIWEDCAMPSMRHLYRWAAGPLFVVLISALAPAAGAADGADFSGKRISIIVPFTEGGGTDSWTRMMAPFLERTLPGHPKVLVLNKPGAGGIVGANFYNEKAPKDGTMIFALSVSTAMNYALGDPRIKFKIEDYHPVLSSPRSSTLYIRKDVGLGDAADIKGNIRKLQSLPPDKLNFGGRTPTSSDLTYRVGFSLLGIEVNSVWGLGGTGPMALGFERGEFQISADNTLAYLSNRSHLVESGVAQPLFTLGNFDDEGKYTRDPALPGVPSFVEVYEATYGKKPSGPGFEAWQGLMGLNVAMNKTLLLHPNVSKGAIEAWRTAVREMLKDPAFLKIAAPELGPYPQIVGDAAKPIMTQALAIKPEARAWLAKYVKVRYNIDLTHK